MTERWHGTLNGYNNHRCRCKDVTPAEREGHVTDPPERSP